MTILYRQWLLVVHFSETAAKVAKPFSCLKKRTPPTCVSCFNNNKRLCSQFRVGGRCRGGWHPISDTTGPFVVWVVVYGKVGREAPPGNFFALKKCSRFQFKCDNTFCKEQYAFFRNIVPQQRLAPEMAKTTFEQRTGSDNCVCAMRPQAGALRTLAVL